MIKVLIIQSTLTVQRLIDWLQEEELSGPLIFIFNLCQTLPQNSKWNIRQKKNQY